MSLVAAALLGIATMVSAIAANNLVPRSQTQNQEWESSEANINRQFQSQEAQTARQFNAEEAQKQRDFEKEMSDTSIQRQIADMQAAGINPASIGLLGGASTPSAASASFGSIPYGASPSAHPVNTGYMTNLFSTAVQAAMSKDKNFTNKAIAEMYVANAKEMNKITNDTRKILKNSYTRYGYNEDGKLSSRITGTNAFNPMDPYKDWYSQREWYKR